MKLIHKLRYARNFLFPSQFPERNFICPLEIIIDTPKHNLSHYLRFGEYKARKLSLCGQFLLLILAVGVGVRNPSGEIRKNKRTWLFS